MKRDKKELDRLRWAIRRGMLELDLVLSPYLEENYLRSSEEDKSAFIKLLKEEDQDLFTWFLQSQPVPNEHAAIVNKIITFKKEHAKENQ